HAPAPSILPSARQQRASRRLEQASVSTPQNAHRCADAKESQEMMPLDHEMIFRRAWEDPAATRYELPAVDVNQALADRYDLGRPLAFTRTLLWDLEARKARRPDLLDLPRFRRHLG